MLLNSISLLEENPQKSTNMKRKMTHMTSYNFWQILWGRQVHCSICRMNCFNCYTRWKSPNNNETHSYNDYEIPFLLLSKLTKSISLSIWYEQWFFFMDKIQNSPFMIKSPTECYILYNTHCCNFILFPLKQSSSFVYTLKSL